MKLATLISGSNSSQIKYVDRQCRFALRCRVRTARSWLRN